MSESAFHKLRQINVNDKTEKKANLTYLSWAWAVDQLLENDPSATWEYHEPQMFGDTMMVSCTVQAFGKPMREYLPVLDHRNKPIANPDAFQVNTSMKRCLAKCIALHGLGLYIYAGEDLPPNEEPEAPQKPAPAKSVPNMEWDKADADTKAWLEEIAGNVRALLNRGDVAGAFDEIEEKNLEIENKTALWSRFDSKERSALKKEGDSRKQPLKEAA